MDPTQHKPVKTQRDIDDIVLMLSIENHNLLDIWYQTKAVKDPFVIVSKATFLPKIIYNPALDIYILDLKPASKLLPHENNLLLYVAHETKKLARAAKTLNILYTAHKQLNK